MAESEKKDYFNIANMTAEFRKIPAGGAIFAEVSRVWELRFQLAIAQQLSVIAGALTRLLEAVERSEGKEG